MNRRITALAGVSLAGLAGATLQLPAEATASPTASKVCSFRAYGEQLKISLQLQFAPNRRDVRGVQLRATDNDESGSYLGDDVRIKNVRLVVIDHDGTKQLSNTVAPSSPGGYDLGSAGEDAGKVRVKVRWRTDGQTVDRSCALTVN